jgi:hypothetical protein
MAHQINVTEFYMLLIFNLLSIRAGDISLSSGSAMKNLPNFQPPKPVYNP